MSDSVRPHRQQPIRPYRPWDSPGKNTGVGCHFLLQCVKVKSESEVAQSCLTLSDPMDCSLPGSSVHGIFQARVLEWVPLPSLSGISYRCLTFIRYRFPSSASACASASGGGGCVSTWLEEGLCRVAAELLERGSKNKRREVVKSHLDKVLEIPPPSSLRLTGCLGTCFPASECVPESGRREEARGPGCCGQKSSP